LGGKDGDVNRGFLLLKQPLVGKGGAYYAEVLGGLGSDTILRKCCRLVGRLIYYYLRCIFIPAIETKNAYGDSSFSSYNVSGEVFVRAVLVEEKHAKQL